VSISATQVKELRERTGAGLMDCRKALAESGGDVDAAMESLRKKGLATAAKRAGRAATEGLIRARVEGAVAGIVELNCETDFVAKNEEFGEFADQLLNLVLSERPATLEALQGLKVPSGLTVAERLSELVGKIGERMLVSRFQIVSLDGPGVIDAYIHANSAAGVLVALGAPTQEIAEKAEVQKIAHEVALHAAFAKPICLSSDEVPKDLVETERRISRERALEQGKPENIVDRIVEGQIQKYYKEVALLEQPYVKEEKSSVKNWLAAQGKALGSELKIQDFACFERGAASGGDAESDG
jgi:elongation factor Ts